ncbi:MAG: hypothetical protein HYR84_05440 [Planctomycetes bacterium]|nr:hypothetical protein [Planctomycetota bacterium]
MPTIKEINSELADKLYDESQNNPQSPYAGKKVGIANGRVVIVADTWGEIVPALEQAEPDASRTFCIDMAQDYTTVQEIWEAM